ncbi:hypothetical protein AOLI_G00177170 [Acnodon oligacanthus]
MGKIVEMLCGAIGSVIQKKNRDHERLPDIDIQAMTFLTFYNIQAVVPIPEGSSSEASLAGASGQQCCEAIHPRVLIVPDRTTGGYDCSQ